ncbi:MAG: CYTH domain-containing protein [Firmicutes bacterium]|nr:CYTH domain-containing protein [Bacillota bacterium]
MESELKYAIPSKETADTIWDDMFLSRYSDNSSAEVVVMKAIYFDTEDHALSRNDVAFRVRSEGELSFATLKWGGQTVNGLHERGEINIPVSGEEIFIQPPVDLFKESEAGQRLIRLIGDKPLYNLLETRFLRRRLKLHYKNSIFELAVDTGSVITDRGNAPVCELEIELYLGNMEDLKGIGAIISRQYGLQPENTSKLARGLSLLALDESEK